MNHFSLSLPQNLTSVVGGEPVDFTVLAERKHPAKASRGAIVFGSVWLAIVGFGLLMLLVPLLQGKEVRFRSNGVRTSAGLHHLGPLAMPLLFMGIFVLIGLAFIFYGLRMRRQKGGYFVGTPTRLIQQNEGSILSYNWEQFSGNVEMNTHTDDLSLQLRTGKMRSRKNGPDEFVPDVVHLSGIPNLLEVERICRQRILEHDPTPPYRA